MKLRIYFCVVIATILGGLCTKTLSSAITFADKVRELVLENEKIFQKIIRKGESNFTDAEVEKVDTQVHAKIQQLINQGYDINQCEPGERTALHWIAWAGFKKSLNLLLESTPGPNLNAVENSNGFTPLHYAASTKREMGNLLRPLNTRLYDDIIKILIKKGANVHAQTKQGRTPLLLATEENCLSRAQAFLEGGADPNMCDNKGYTPLYKILRQVALQPSSYKDVLLLVKLLIEHGANPTMKTTFKGPTSLRGIFEEHDFPKEESPLHLLARITTLPNAPSSLGPSLLNALIYQPLKAQSEMRTELLNLFPQALVDSIILDYASEFNINVPDKDGRTPLMIAAEGTTKKYIDHFVKQVGRMPTMGNNQVPNKEFLKTLIQAGAKTTITDNYDKTALDYATANGHADVLKEAEKLAAHQLDTPEEPEEPIFQPDMRQHSRIKERNLMVLSFAVAVALTAAHAWHRYQQKKRFTLIVQRLVDLEQRRLSHQISDFVYTASKDMLLAPYQKDPNMLKKIETEVAIHLETFQVLEGLV